MNYIALEVIAQHSHVPYLFDLKPRCLFYFYTKTGIQLLNSRKCFKQQLIANWILRTKLKFLSFRCLSISSYLNPINSLCCSHSSIGFQWKQPKKKRARKFPSFPFVMYFLDRINIMYLEQLLLTCVHKLIAFRLSYNQIRQAEKRFCSPQKLGTHRIIYRGFVCVDFYGEHGETVNDLAMDEMKLPLKIFVMKIIFQNHVFCGPNEGESQQNKYQTFIYLFPSWLSPITSITKLNLLLELYNNCVFNMKYNQRNGNGHVFIRFLRPKKRNRHKCFNFVLNGNKSTKPLYKTSS